MKAGDVILKLGAQPIVDARDLHRALEAAEPGAELAVQVLRNGQSLELTLTLGGHRERRARQDGEQT
jgi:S1-C subfamily serine protease